MWIIILCWMDSHLIHKLSMTVGLNIVAFSPPITIFPNHRWWYQKIFQYVQLNLWRCFYELTWHYPLWNPLQCSSFIAKLLNIVCLINSIRRNMIAHYAPTIQNKLDLISCKYCTIKSLILVTNFSKKGKTA